VITFSEVKVYDDDDDDYRLRSKAVRRNESRSLLSRNYEDDLHTLQRSTQSCLLFIVRHSRPPMWLFYSALVTTEIKLDEIKQK